MMTLGMVAAIHAPVLASGSPDNQIAVGSSSRAAAPDNVYLDPPPIRGTAGSVRCSYDPTNTTEQRFVAIYAIPKDFDRSDLGANGDRSSDSALVARFRQAIFDASQYMDGEADLAPGTTNPPPKARESVQRLKFLCDVGTLNPTIQRVVLTKTMQQVNDGSIPLGAPRSSPFNAIKYDIRARSGFNKANEKYLVFYDAPSTDSKTGRIQFGEGNTCSQETASASNTCNTQSALLTVDAAYAIDFADFLKNDPNWHTFLHEASHTLGAVHAGAPHTNGTGHCTDDEDVMCYDEDGSPSAEPVCEAVATIPASPGLPSGQRLGRYDCGQDDYFNPDVSTLPTSGPNSYLRTKWNIAAGYNKFVYHGTTEAVSRTTTSGTPNQGSYSPSISENGRYVAFESDASDLGGDNSGVRDIFRRDRWTGAITHVSVGISGLGKGNSFLPKISPDGGYVAFSSVASNLVTGDSNGVSDVFVRDVAAGTTTRVSVTNSGGQADKASDQPAISRDGRYVAFRSDATNLPAVGDTNAAADVFVRDRIAGGTARVSIDSAGGQSNAASSEPSISADGQRIVFSSSATNLVGGDSNGYADVFLRNRSDSTTTRISVTAGSGQGTGGGSSTPSIAAAGFHVAFSSSATNLVSGDSNGRSDVFLRDLTTATTTRVSISSSGAEATGAPIGPGSWYPGISADGRFVAFTSYATNLVVSDTNDESDVFVRDIWLGQTTRQSLTWDDQQGDSGALLSGATASSAVTLSSDGRYLAFHSPIALTSNDTSTYSDIFEHGVF